MGLDRNIERIELKVDKDVEFDTALYGRWFTTGTAFTRGEMSFIEVYPYGGSPCGAEVVDITVSAEDLDRLNQRS